MCRKSIQVGCVCICVFVCVYMLSELVERHRLGDTRKSWIYNSLNDDPGGGSDEGSRDN